MTMRFESEQMINFKEGIYHRKTTPHIRKSFTVALFETVKIWKQPKGLY